MKKLLLSLLVLPLFSGAQIIKTIAGNGTAAYSGDGGVATAASLNGPNGLAVDAAGNIYVSDYWNNAIRKITPAGIITTIAGTGVGGFGGDGGPATNAQFDLPLKITIDAAGSIYVADRNNNRIRKITSSGTITTIAGTGTTGSTGDGGPATAAQLNSPAGVSIDAAGNIYIADMANNKVRKISATGIISTIAGTGAAGSMGDGGQATAAQLSLPFGVVSDATGNIYIAEPGSHKVRKITPAGIISTFAGTGTSGYGGDSGPATAAMLNNASGVLCDASGNVYIGDQYNNRVRKVSASGIITTIAGTGTGSYGGDGGSPVAAMINQANEMKFDNSGNLVITDNLNHRVRRIASGTSGITAQPAHDMLGNPAITVDPNPASDDILISMNEIGGTKHISLLNSIGQVAGQQQTTTTSAKLSLGTLPAGMYVVRIQYDGGTYYKKIVKQ